MNVIICDDNRKFASMVEEALMELELINIEYEVFYSGESLCSYLSDGNSASIYFLDIEVEEKDGIEVGNFIRKKDDKAVIIFMTQHREYVYRVFECLPFRFVEKPFLKEKIQKVFQESLDYIYASRKFYFFKIGKTQYQIAYDDILYFEGRGRKVCICTKQGNYEFYGKIQTTFEELDANIFVRVHISYIVNMDAIRSIEIKDLVLSDGTELPISKPYRIETKQNHMKYMMWKSGV